MMILPVLPWDPFSPCPWVLVLFEWPFDKVYELGSSNDLLGCCAAGLGIGGWGGIEVGLDGIEGLIIDSVDEGNGGALD